MKQYIEDLFYHKRSSVATLRISTHFFPVETGQMMNKPREHRMCPFACISRLQMSTTILSSALTLNLFQTKLFEAIFELADQKTYSYESTQDLLLKLLSDKSLSASPRISKLPYTLLETYNNIAQP